MLHIICPLWMSLICIHNTQSAYGLEMLSLRHANMKSLDDQTKSFLILMICQGIHYFHIYARCTFNVSSTCTWRCVINICQFIEVGLTILPCTKLMVCPFICLPNNMKPHNCTFWLKKLSEMATIFRWHFQINFSWILIIFGHWIQILLKFVLKGPINNRQALV